MACCRDGVRISRWDSRVLRPSFCCIATSVGTRGRNGRWQSWSMSPCPGMSHDSRACSVELEAFTEVNPANLFVGGQLARRSRSEHLALPENISAIGDFQGLSHVVIGDEHADPAGLQVGDDL